MALLYGDPDGFDKLDAWPDEAKLFGEDFFLRAKSFGYVHAYGTPGGGDLALLHDADTDDTFTAWPDEAKLTGPEFFLRAKSFGYVHAYATEGADVATFYGSDDRDVFVATDRASKLRGDGFFNRAVAFEEVHAYGGGGRDVAVLHDAALEIGLTDPLDATQLAYLYEFERIRQKVRQPATTTHRRHRRNLHRLLGVAASPVLPKRNSGTGPFFGQQVPSAPETWAEKMDLSPFPPLGRQRAGTPGQQCEDEDEGACPGPLGHVRRSWLILPILLAKSTERATATTE